MLISTPDSKQSNSLRITQLAWELDSERGNCATSLYVVASQGAFIVLSGSILSHCIRGILTAIAIVISVIVCVKWVKICSSIATKVTAIINLGDPPINFQEIIPCYCKKKLIWAALLVNFQLSIVTLISVIHNAARQ